MDHVSEASRALGQEIRRAHVDGDGSMPEADAGVNDASRRMIEAVKREHGSAWLYKINLHGEERGNEHEAAFEWDGSSPIYNFGCDAVAPFRDAELVGLIMARDAGPYTSVRDDVPRVNAIMDRIRAIGAHLVIWT